MTQFTHLIIAIILFNITFHFFLKRQSGMKKHITAGENWLWNKWF